MPASPVVVGTPVYSGDTAAVGELVEETPTEWTERAGEKDPGDGEVGVVSVTGNSSSLSAEGEKRRQNIWIQEAVSGVKEPKINLQLLWEVQTLCVH